VIEFLRSIELHTFNVYTSRKTRHQVNVPECAEQPRWPYHLNWPSCFC